MRCKKHLQDLTSTVGVCSSCLRNRLEPLVQAQAQAQGARVSPRASAVAASDDIKKPEHDSVGLNFLRSVSPYVSRRPTDRDRRLDRSSYSTPQAGPKFSDGACDGGKTPSSKKRLGRFWNLFQSRSNKSEISSRETCDPSVATAASPSWFSTILPARRQNRRRDCERSDHGVSKEDNFTSESPQRRKNTAAVGSRWRLGSAGKRVAGMVICLSPMVGASHKKELSAPVVVGGAHNLISYCGNRSRKLADFGRVTTHNYY